MTRIGGSLEKHTKLGYLYADYKICTNVWDRQDDRKSTHDTEAHDTL